MKYALPVTRGEASWPTLTPRPCLLCGAPGPAPADPGKTIAEGGRPFDSLFLHLHAQEPGSLAYRWKRVLARMDETSPAALADLVQGNIDR